MSTSNTTIKVSGISVQILRKKIKNLHLGVYPPDGIVRVSVPQHITNENVRLAVISRLGWIKKQQEAFKNQPRQTEREYVSGESHYFLGKRYLLKVIERYGKHEVELKNNSKMLLYVQPGTSRQNRELVINNWYRQNLKETTATLLKKWEPKVGKKVQSWGIKKMKTKWGSCNIPAKRIWLNLELAKKPSECLEYILVHELVHLHERLHNDNFKQLMDKYLPAWRKSRDILKREPLAYETWEY